MTTATAAVSPDAAAADRLTTLVGEHSESWAAAVELDPKFAAAYTNLAAVPEHNGHLDARSRALIALAVSASVTTLDPAGIRTAVAQAARAGATREEVVEAVQLVSVLGVHTLVTGFPELSAVLDGRGERLVSDGPLSERQEQIRDDFRSQRGYWSELNEMLLRVDHEMFEAYTAYSSHPWLHGVLSPKLRELIYIAIDLSPTHLFTTGVRPHIENALRYGATAAEIVETMQVTALVGIASVRAAAPVIREVFG